MVRARRSSSTRSLPARPAQRDCCRASFSELRSALANEILSHREPDLLKCARACRGCTDRLAFVKNNFYL